MGVKVLEIVNAAIEKGCAQKITEAEQIFFYLPHGHSKDLEVQKYSVELFSQAVDCDQEFAAAHFCLTERFGRFPHWNAVLGRKNTPEEDEYLNQPREGFEVG